MSIIRIVLIPLKIFVIERVNVNLSSGIYSAKYHVQVRRKRLSLKRFEVRPGVANQEN